MLRRDDLRFSSNAAPSGSANGPSYRRMAPSNMQLNNTNQLYAQLPGNEGFGHQGVQPHSMDNMSQAFNGVNLQGVQSAGVIGQNNNAQLASPIYYQLPNGTYIIPNVNNGPTQGRNAYGGLYTPQASYMMNPNGASSLTPPGQQNVPELGGPRRSSLSSNEENGPHTPFFGSTAQGMYQPNITADHSPQLWGTHSPAELGQAFYPQPLAKSPDGVYTYLDLDALCCRHPAIPRSVPAIFSGEKGRGTLEKSLQNQTGTTNVYIRGLLPDTTDEMLHSYGERFGDIMSAKSMLDQTTGLCKGFGFIKYHNETDGENCIRGFFHWGYEAKWARQSHNERLKTLGDANNTNLYVSNLPADTNECGLKAIFAAKDYNCISAKILRDPNGLSRGVGFARFETPAICEEVISTFSGQSVGTEGAVLAIRYADTENQKILKTKTAKSRQFKTDEYNAAVYAPQSPYNMVSPSNGGFPSPINTSFASPLQIRLPNALSGYWQNASPVSPIYPSFPQTAQGYHIPTMANARPFNNENTPPILPSRYNARVKIESPSVAALAKRTGGSQAHASSPLATPDGDVQGVKTDPGNSPLRSPKSTPSKSAA